MKSLCWIAVADAQSDITENFLCGRWAAYMKQLKRDVDKACALA
jgi:hypothetical protein